MKVDLVVVGGGIVGYASARAIALRRPDWSILLLEAEPELAAQQTGHNSGVIHSGLYYKPGSAKARNCVAGREALLAFCESEGVPYKLSGKLVAATREREVLELEKLHQRGIANGLRGLERLTPDQAREIEPELSCVDALWVPQTGVVDFGEVTQAIAAHFRRLNGIVWTSSPVRAATRKKWHVVCAHAQSHY